MEKIEPYSTKYHPDIDFAEIFDRLDTLVMGRRTFEANARDGRW